MKDCRYWHEDEYIADAKKFKKAHGIGSVPRKLFEFSDGAGQEHHVLVSGRLRSILKVRKHHRYPRWLEVFEDCVRAAEKFTYQASYDDSPYNLAVFQEPVIANMVTARGSNEVLEIVRFSWTEGYSYSRGFFGENIRVNILPVFCKNRYWADLVQILKTRVIHARWHRYSIITDGRTH